MRPIGYALCAGVLGLGALAAEPQKGDLAAADPIKIVRTQSPYDDLFLREEYLEEHSPGIPVRNRLCRLSVVSKERQVLLFDAAYREGNETLFGRYEWKDVTGDGQPELLVYAGDISVHHSRSGLKVYQVRKQDSSGKECPSFLYKVFEGFYNYETWQTYPTTLHQFGVFVFEKDQAGLSCILWKPAEGNKDTPELTRWTWDAGKGTFKPGDWQQDTPGPPGPF